MLVPRYAPNTALYLGGCVEGRCRYGGALLGIDEFRCLHDGPELRAERWHPQHVVTLCFSGTFFYCAEGKRQLADPTSATFLPGSISYNTQHPWGCNCHGINIFLRDDVAEELLHIVKRWSARERTLSLPPASQLVLRRMLARLEALGPGDSGLAIEEEVLSFLADLVRPPEAPVRHARRRVHAGTEERHERCVAATCALLNQHYRESLSLEMISKAVHASPTHLTRVFSRATGMSVHRYRTRLRLLGALDEICAGNRDLSRLAVDLGFSSHSHLTATFRKEFGKSPAALRKELKAASPRAQTWARARAPRGTLGV